MRKTVVKRIHKRNLALPDQSDFIDPQFLVIPPGGFAWIEGRSGPHRTKQSFLIPMSGSKMRGAARRPGFFAPPDLYLTFAELPPRPEAALAFANEFGQLGLVQRHFHSEQSPIQSAECWSDWLAEIRTFQNCWQAWLLIHAQDRTRLRKFLGERSWPRMEGLDLLVAAKIHLMMEIDARLTPQRVYPEPCFRSTCDVGGVYRVKLSPFVTYSLNFAASMGPTLSTTAIVGRLYPTALISNIWLQLAEVVTGSRFLRRCEKCGRWMDITESPRKRAKRMHDNCSLALRMARYRHKKRVRK